MNFDFLVWDFEIFFNIISILTCNRYDSHFNAVTHIYNVFPGIINTYHPGQIFGSKKKNLDWLLLASVSTQFEFFQILPCFLRSSVWSCLFDKRFCRISAICSHFLKNLYLFGASWFDNVMACTLSSKMREIEHPLFFYHTPFPLNSENCPPPSPTAHF